MDRWEIPIVVGGCHRSGTSLVRRILDAHTRIHCGPELPFFRDFDGDYADDRYRHLRFSTTVRQLLPADEALTALGGALVEVHQRAARRAGKPRWADKAPENVLHGRAWQALLGDEWLFVHVVRNPLDTMASIAQARFPLTLPHDLHGRIDHYVRFVTAGLAVEAARPARSIRVVYEALVADPAAEIDRLMGFLGETAEPAQLRFNDVPHQAGLEDPNVATTDGVHGASVHGWPQRLSAGDAVTVWERASALWASIDPSGAHVRPPARAHAGGR